MEKYGFVYLWYDRKHNRFYVGCRWGKEDDGYICSSVWMKRSYNRRPTDFKRRILERVYTSRKDLLEREHYWLQQIKQEELGQKYYNIRNHHFSHWSTDPIKTKEIAEKAAKGKQGIPPPCAGWNKGIKYPPHLKARMKKTPEARQRMSEAHKGKISPFKGKSRNYSQEVRKKMGHMKGKPVDPILVEIRRQSIKQLIWITNGTISKRINLNKQIPYGFVKGRFKK